MDEEEVGDGHAWRVGYRSTALLFAGFPLLFVQEGKLQQAQTFIIHNKLH